MSNLSAIKVSSLRKPGRFGDGGGLYLVVRPSGSKSWVLRIVADGKRRDLGLGRYPDTSLAQAREKARELRSAIGQGRSPFADRRKSTIPTFREAAHAVLELNRPRWSSEKYASSWGQMLELHAMPALGDVRVDLIGRQDVLKVLTPIWTGSPSLAKRLRQRMSTIFRWAMSHEHMEHNPAGEDLNGALPPMPKVKNHLRSLPHGEVPEALRKVHESDASLSARLCFRFVVLTAARSGEARGAVWDEVDLEAGTWTIPTERMKTRELHRVPLSRQAMGVIEEAKGLRTSSDLLFPSVARAGRPLSDWTLMVALRTIGLSERATVHGFRTSFRTWTLEETDAPWAVAEAALAHGLGNEVERSYARSDLFARRRKLMQDWADYILPS